MTYYKRNIDIKLMEWKASQRRKPLLIRGARQVGNSRNYIIFMVKTYISLLLCACCQIVSAQARTGDPLYDLLRNEMTYYYQHLSQDSVPVQFMSFGALDEKTISIDSDMGCATMHETNGRRFCPKILFGTLNDGKGLNRFDYKEAEWMDSQMQMTDLPYENDAKVIKSVIWNALSRIYRGQMAIWQKTKKKSIQMPLVAKDSAAVHYEEPLAEASFDKEYWKQLLNKTTAVQARKTPEAHCLAHIEGLNQRRYIIDSEGTAVVSNRQSFVLAIRASVKDFRGVEIALGKEYFAYKTSELPDQETLAHDMEVLAQRTFALSKAPMAEAYSGPVILSGNSSAVFFHEVFGHRLERQDSEFASMRGNQVLPTDFTVTCNPQQQYLGGTPLAGYYRYDDEGSMGQKVECVKDGKMANMLTCLSQQAVTNGHGRSLFGNDPATRQSNLIVETSHPYTETELRKMLINELKRQKKDYGYYIKSVSNGWTTLRSSAKVVSSFNIFPAETYRIYTDGRADELVRGVSLIGTPLSAFSNIKAAGGNVEVFNGRCGSGSGWIPVSSCSPMVYVSQIETQVIDYGEGCTDTFPHLDFQTLAENGTQDADSVIFKAMKDEIDKGMTSEINGQHPMFLDYYVRRQATTKIVSSLGSCLKYEPEGVKNSGLVQVIAGNRMQTSYSGNTLGRPFLLPDEICYYHLRSELSQRTAIQFRNATDWLVNNQIEVRADSLPEWLELLGRTVIESSALDGWQKDAELLKVLANKLSEVLGTYSEFTSSRVEIEQKYIDCYRVTSEGLKMRTPFRQIKLLLFADLPMANGTKLNVIDGYGSICDVADLPPTDSLIAFVRRTAEFNITQCKATRCDDLEYMGPVLYEGSAANVFLQENTYNKTLSTYIHTHFNLNKREYDNTYQKIGKKVVSNHISLTQLSNDSVFDGHRLLRYRHYDADGVRPQTVELIRDGILLRQLSGRVPSPGAKASTGNESFREMQAPTWPTMFESGVMRIDCNKTMSRRKLQKKLCVLARQQGLPYAYILKGRSVLMRVDTKTGKEELVQQRCSDQPSMLELMGDVMASKEMTAEPGTSVIHPQAILLPMADLSFEDLRTTALCERFLELRH